MGKDHRLLLVVFHRGQSDTKFPQVSRTLLIIYSILTMCDLDYLDSSFDFQFLPFSFHVFGTNSINNWHHRRPYLPQFFCSLASFKYLSIL